MQSLIINGTSAASCRKPTFGIVTAHERIWGWNAVSDLHNFAKSQQKTRQSEEQTA